MWPERGGVGGWVWTGEGIRVGLVSMDRVSRRGMVLLAAGVLVAAGVLLGAGGGGFGVAAGDGTWTPEAWVYLPYVRGGVGVTPCYAPLPSGSRQPPAERVVITEVFYEGVKGPQEPDEYVEFRNEDTRGIDLEGWALRDEQAHVFTFPSFVIGAEEVWMGRQGEGGRWQVVDSRRECRSRGWAWARGWASNG
jgi:hypothetical protein